VALTGRGALFPPSGHQQGPRKSLTSPDALGQKTIEMARHYARGADLSKKMEGVAKTFGREVNRRRTKASNLIPKVSNGQSASGKGQQKAEVSAGDSSGRTRTRTLDPLIKSQLLQWRLNVHRYSVH
jgi:hypothetical protein